MQERTRRYFHTSKCAIRRLEHRASHCHCRAQTLHSEESATTRKERRASRATAPTQESKKTRDSGQIVPAPTTQAYEHGSWTSCLFAAPCVTVAILVIVFA